MSLGAKEKSVSRPETNACGGVTASERRNELSSRRFPTRNELQIR